MGKIAPSILRSAQLAYRRTGTVANWRAKFPGAQNVRELSENEAQSSVASDSLAVYLWPAAHERDHKSASVTPGRYEAGNSRGMLALEEYLP